MRDNQTDTARHQDVASTVDMRPGYILEQSMMSGFDRTSKPVGQADPTPDEFQSTGGRGTADAVAARQLGTNGRK
jgi:hypothetical protein